MQAAEPSMRAWCTRASGACSARGAFLLSESEGAVLKGRTSFSFEGKHAGQQALRALGRGYGGVVGSTA